MGMPVVTVASGGMPVVEAIFGTPVTEAANGYGMPVTKVIGKPGLPVVFETIGVGAPTPAVFNSGDAAANITISGGGRQVNASGTTPGAVRTNKSQSTGKFYFEVAWTSANGGAGFDGAGIATQAAALSGGNPSLPGNAALGCIIIAGGTIFYNTLSTGISLGAFINNVACIAVDTGNKRFWGRKDGGLWNNSGAADPAANVGGIDISTVFSAAAVYGAVTKNGAVPVAVGNFGQAAFTQAVPSGFTAGLLA